MKFIPKSLYNRVRGKLINLKKKGTISSKVLKKARLDTIGIRKAYGVKRRAKFKL